MRRDSEGSHGQDQFASVFSDCRVVEANMFVVTNRVLGRAGVHRRAAITSRRHSAGQQNGLPTQPSPRLRRAGQAAARGALQRASFFEHSLEKRPRHKGSRCCFPACKLRAWRTVGRILPFLPAPSSLLPPGAAHKSVYWPLWLRLRRPGSKPGGAHQKTRCEQQRVCTVETDCREARRLLLPGTLLVPVGLQALSALVLVHLQTALLFKVAHGSE